MTRVGRICSLSLWLHLRGGRLANLHDLNRYCRETILVDWSAWKYISYGVIYEMLDHYINPEQFQLKGDRPAVVNTSIPQFTMFLRGYSNVLLDITTSIFRNGTLESLLMKSVPGSVSFGGG